MAWEWGGGGGGGVREGPINTPISRVQKFHITFEIFCMLGFLCMRNPILNSAPAISDRKAFKMADKHGRPAIIK